MSDFHFCTGVSKKLSNVRDLKGCVRGQVRQRPTTSLPATHKHPQKRLLESELSLALQKQSYVSMTKSK